MENLYKYLKLSGLLYVFGILTFWIIYFLSLDSFVSDDSSNRIFTNMVFIVYSLYMLGLLGFGSLLFFSKRKLFKVVSFLITIPMILLALFPVFFADSTEDYVFTLNTNVSLLVVIFTYLLAPALTAYFIKPNKSILLILAVLSVILYLSVLLTNSTYTQVIGSRWGGFNLNDLFYSIVQLPFILYVAYVSFNANNLKVFVK